MTEDGQQNQITSELRTLIHRSFDEPLSDVEVRRIEKALGENAELRQWYIKVVQLHADLSSQSQAQEICKLVQDEFPNAQEPLARSSKTRRILSLSSWRFAYRLSPVPIAASILILGLSIGCGVGLFAASIIYVRPIFKQIPWTWKVDDDVVAKIESTRDAQWQASESPETLPTRGVRAGQQIRLDSGLMQMSFRNGAGVVLIGPAVFEVRSETGGKLYSGRLSATTPPEVSSFNVETPAGLFQFGPGHYGVDVSVTDTQGATTFHAFVGIAAGINSAHFRGDTGIETELMEGDALRIDAKGNVEFVPLAVASDFATQIVSDIPEPFEGDIVPLGNLFDDSKSASLRDAVESDTYQAAGEIIDLGIAAIHDGGLDIDVSLAEDGVRFNMRNTGGGGPRVNGLPSNDSYRSISSVPIRTSGTNFSWPNPESKIEEGIGMSTNELITFDLDELREAGGLQDRPMRFVADRAGINDRYFPPLPDERLASARFIVIVSSEDNVLAGFVDGSEYKVIQRGGVFSFDFEGNRLPAVLRRTGRFVSFDVPIPPEARFLTLATAMHDVEHDDHAVFSGARLELLPRNEATDVAKADVQ